MSQEDKVKVGQEMVDFILNSDNVFLGYESIVFGSFNLENKDGEIVLLHNYSIKFYDKRQETVSFFNDKVAQIKILDENKRENYKRIEAMFERFEPKTTKIEEEQEARLRQSDDILKAYPRSKLLEQGEMWYKAWDICDRYYIVETEGGPIMVFYSTNGHGFGVDYIVKQGDESGLDGAFLSIAVDSDNDSVESRWREKILDSWKIVD